MMPVYRLQIEIDPVLADAITADCVTGGEQDLAHVLADMAVVCHVALLRGEPLLKFVDAEMFRRLYD